MAMATDGRSSGAIWRAGLLAFWVAGAAGAQVGAYSAPAPAGDAAQSPSSAGAASTNARGGWLIVPTLTLRETATDNVNQAPPGTARSDWVTEIVPGIRIDGQGARVKLHLDYRMDNVVYARESSNNNLQNYLDASGSLEAIENFLFLDARAAISQEAISPFGPRPTDATSINNNRTETRTYQLSPYIRGRLFGATDYLVRYDYTDMHSQSSASGDSKVGNFSAHLAGITTLTQLSWSAEATAESVDNQFTRDTQDNRVRGVLTYAIDPQFKINGTLGYERNDLITLETTGNSTYGGGFEWAPTSRSKVWGNWERRFFGDGWNYGVSNHSPYLSFTISDTRDVTTDAQSSLGGSGFQSAYNLLFSALATRFPDPIDRAAEAQRLLHSGSIPSDLGLPPDFIVGTAYLEDRQQASVTLLGVRNTISFSVYQTTRDALFAPGENVGVLPPGTNNTHEWGAGANFIHRLTAFTTLNAGATWRKTNSTSGPDVTSKEWTARAGLSSSFGRLTTGSLEYRYTKFDSDTGGASDYRENALIASLLMQF
ncbi:MAG TPA: TIGR03016 family PEP-CTERM system-associated outer membrane protein [Casimicrobiaceae bacterium]|nr:TIGR03016 family PEP-CTERM system-associated outer membrane protein [Casimicrobiaceae bacterium]